MTARRLGGRDPLAEVGRHRSFHLNSLYPLWIPFGKVSAAFLNSKSYEDSLKDFRNEWEGST